MGPVTPSPREKRKPVVENLNYIAEYNGWLMEGSAWETYAYDVSPSHGVSLRFARFRDSELPTNGG